MHEAIKEIITRSPHLKWLETNILILGKSGSYSHGTNIEGSDLDYKGTCVEPIEYSFGILNNFEQAILNDPYDCTVFSLKKFLQLGINNNPSILELLFLEPEDYIYVSSLGQKIIDNRSAFLSKKLKFTLSGYAISQLNRIKLHKEFLNKGNLVKPARSDYGLPERNTRDKNQVEAALATIDKEMRAINFDFMDHLEDSVKIEVKRCMKEMFLKASLTKEDQFLGIGRDLGISDSFMAVLQKEKEYNAAVKTYENWLDWKKNRNPKRAELEAKNGFDCYVEETEFLTESGWKTFDQITDIDKLATVNYNKNFILEYQNYTNKFDSLYSGNIYNLFGNHTDVQVTANHNMLVQKEERNTGIKYDWKLEQISNLPDCFNIIRNITPNKKNYCNQHIKSFQNLPIRIETYLKLMGWYLSNGSMSFYKSKSGKYPKAIRISEIKNGKLYKKMVKTNSNFEKLNIGSHLYNYNKKINTFNPKTHIEYVLSISNNTIINSMFDDCSYTVNKKIPRYVYGLSVNLMNILLEALIDGDGIRHRLDNSMIYYSKSKELANDVQELAFMCGYETSLYGPYNSIKQCGNKTYNISVYQVHINKTREQSKKCIRHSNIKITPVLNKRVVCFTVPNSVLVTRLNGHVAIQGNCKHAAHLVRLTNIAKEVLTTGKYLVRRPDAEFLKSIRNGAWTYEQLLEFADNSEKELNELYEKCTILPREPDRKLIDKLCIEIYKEFI